MAVRLVAAVLMEAAVAQKALGELLEGMEVLEASPADEVAEVWNTA